MGEARRRGTPPRMTDSSRQTGESLRAIFDRAIELQGEDRARYLAQACGTDATLRRDVDSLLRWEAGGHFERPLAEGFPERIGPARVVGRIGIGGMAEVFRGEMPHGGEEVAIKTVREGFETDDEVLARFAEEKAILSALTHPGICKFLDDGVDVQGRPFFVMEHVDGVPLTEHCDTGELSIRERMTRWVEVCRAVEHAHSRGIIHRDLKPSNILVTSEGVTKVIDFGVAKSLDRSDSDALTQTGQSVGTFRYMSPEQATGRLDELDQRTDIYSLGLLAYELAVSTLPWESEAEFGDIGTLLSRVSGIAAPSLLSRLRALASTDRIAEHRSTTLDRLTSDLEQLSPIIGRAIESRIDLRYPTLSEFRGEIEAWVKHGASSKERSSRRGLVAASVLVVLTAIVGLVLYGKREDAPQGNSTNQVLFADDFESGELDGWTLGGRRGSGENNVSVVTQEGGGRVARIRKTGLYEVMLTRLVEFRPTEEFRWRMKAEASRALSRALPIDVTRFPRTSYSMAGVGLELLGASQNELGRVEFVTASTRSPFDTQAGTQSRRLIEVRAGEWLELSKTARELADLTGLQTDAIKSVRIRLFAYGSTLPEPLVEAELLVDDIVVSIDE